MRSANERRTDFEYYRPLALLLGQDDAQVPDLGRGGDPLACLGEEHDGIEYGGLPNKLLRFYLVRHFARRVATLP